MAKKTSVDRIGAEIDRILNGYSKEVQEEVDKVTKSRTFAGVNILRKHANSAGFKGGKDYIAAMAGRTTSKGTNLKGTLYVKSPHYRLAHLLENGHVIRNQYGTYGRTRAFKHWEPAEKEHNKRYEEEVTKAIKGID